MAKGLPSRPPLAGLKADLERVKCYLWHGNVFQALQVLDHIEIELEFKRWYPAMPHPETPLRLAA
jgi:hypothetical protein